MKSFLLPLQFFLLFLFFILPFQASAQISGCTDPMSLNYNSMATINDSSCTYPPSTITPKNSFPLGSEVTETSGLVFWNDKLWTHKDDNDTNLYALSPLDGNILETYTLLGVTNTDWEAISQDDDYIYIGDFGNNTHGNRTDLRIYKISKDSLLSGTVQAEAINFVYEDQNDFSSKSANATDFDCEAFIVSSNKIFLFTKQWLSNQTAIYSLSKKSGDQIAHLQGNLNIQGLVTDATFMEGERLVVLSGYSPLLQPFLFLLYDFDGTDFRSANKRKINLNLPFHQIEGITTENGMEYYLTNEYFSLNQALKIPQKLHHIDLSDYLTNYMDNLGISEVGKINNGLSFYPNPTDSIITIKASIPLNNANYVIFNELGQKVMEGKLPSDQTIYVSHLSPSLYYLRIEENHGNIMRIIKR